MKPKRLRFAATVDAVENQIAGALPGIVDALIQQATATAPGRGG